MVSSKTHTARLRTGARRRQVQLAIIAPGEVYGGVERFVNVLAGAFQERAEVKPLVILFHDGVQADMLRAQAIDVVIPEQRGKYDVSMARKLADLFRKKQIDIVHTNGYKATIVGAIAARLSGIPVVKTEHGKLEPGSWFNPRHLRMRVNLVLDEIATRSFVHHTVYVTHDMQCMFRRNNDLKKSSIIYNGINPVQIDSSARPPEIDPDFFNIGMVGRLTGVKGHRVLLQALTYLRDLRDLRVHIIGEGSLKSKLEEFCATQRLSEVIQFHGFKENIYDYIAALDALVMPSLHEGLPYVLLESMYLKTPIIASDIGGPGEILENNIDALLVKPGDERALAEAIRALHEDQALQGAVAENAFRKARRDLTAETMVEDYLEVYHRMLQSVLADNGVIFHAVSSGEKSSHGV